MRGGGSLLPRGILLNERHHSLSIGSARSSWPEIGGGDFGGQDGGSAALVSRARLRIWKLREGVSGGRIWLRFSPPHPPPPLHCKAAGSHGPPKTEKGRRGKGDRFASPLADAVEGGGEKAF